MRNGIESAAAAVRTLECDVCCDAGEPNGDGLPRPQNDEEQQPPREKNVVGAASRGRGILVRRGDAQHERGEVSFKKNAAAQYALEDSSLPPISGQFANSRNDSRPFSNSSGDFRFTKNTRCVLAEPDCSESATQTKIPEGF